MNQTLFGETWDTPEETEETHPPARNDFEAAETWWPVPTCEHLSAGPLFPKSCFGRKPCSSWCFTYSLPAAWCCTTARIRIRPGVVDGLAASDRGAGMQTDLVKHENVLNGWVFFGKKQLFLTRHITLIMGNLLLCI